MITRPLLILLASLCSVPACEASKNPPDASRTSAREPNLKPPEGLADDAPEGVDLASKTLSAKDPYAEEVFDEEDPVEWLIRYGADLSALTEAGLTHYYHDVKLSEEERIAARNTTRFAFSEVLNPNRERVTPTSASSCQGPRRTEAALAARLAQPGFEASKYSKASQALEALRGELSACEEKLAPLQSELIAMKLSYL